MSRYDSNFDFDYDPVAVGLLVNPVKDAPLIKHMELTEEDIKILKALDQAFKD